MNTYSFLQSIGIVNDHLEDVLYYTHQCPFNAKYVPVVEETAAKNGISFKAILLDSRENARNAPTPVTTYALFHNGKYITSEQMNDRKLLKPVLQLSKKRQLYSQRTSPVRIS